MALPVHIKGLIIAGLTLLSAWLIITPIYLEVISWAVMPSWCWMLIGAFLLIFTVKFGKVIL